MGDTFPKEVRLYHELVMQRVPGLVRPLIADGPYEEKAASCTSDTAGRTHAVLIGGDDIGVPGFRKLEGPANDLTLISQVLRDRGVAADAIHVLSGWDATRASISAAFHKVLADLSCNDRVIVHVSAPSTETRGFLVAMIAAGKKTLTAEDAALVDGKKTETFLSRLSYAVPTASDLETKGRTYVEQLAGLKIGIGDDLAILLNSDDPERYEVILGSDVSDFMVAVRNRGAHAVAVLDVLHASQAGIEDKQRAAGDDTVWTYQFDTGSLNVWNKPVIAATRGDFAVLYASESNEVTIELKLPKGAPDAKMYGLFSFAVAGGILETPAASPRTLGAAIDKFYREGNRVRYHPRIEASNPDLVIVAEAAPPADDPIKIISPAPQRGAAVMERTEVEIEGLVEWPARLLGVFVNDSDAAIEPGGRFRHTVTLKTGLNVVNVRAVTADNRMHQRRIELLFEGDRQALVGDGRRFAVVIANQTYGGATGMPNLTTPFADADALAAVLQRDYGFTTELALDGGRALSLALRDPSKRDIEFALHQLGKVAGSKDTVLIFYAGHGVFEPVTSIAYWVPSDAERGFEPSYLSAADISAAIQRMQAGKVILISDSCYSGALLRGADGSQADTIPEQDRIEALLKLQASRSRIVISSGNNEPVADQGGGGHSVFARALLTGLEKMDHDAFSARELFDRFILQQVAANSDQEPQFRPLEKVGHEGGDFVFVRSPPGAESAAAP
ncbi:MAG: caspase family protein [Rhizobiaceae bacterium]|nr:caspase family protein [Rhizobiaceae bacterium]